MDDYWTDFVQESEAHITELNNALLQLEASPDDEDAMDGIFRTAHTLKGNCGAMGLTRASDLAHAIEDLLEAVRTGDVEVTPSLMDTVFEGVDELDAMLDEVAASGAIQRDPSPTIEALRGHVDRPDGHPSISAPTDDEIDAVLARIDPPADDDHDAYLVRLAIDEVEGATEGVDNAVLVVEALIDAFDLLGTDPSREAIERGEYDGTFDAVFGTAVGEAAIAAALEPVGAVDDFEIVTVTDRFADAARGATSSVDASDGDGGEAAGGRDISAERAQELSVDELLDEFSEFDDLDELVEDVDDVSAFEDMGDAGSFDDLLDDEPLEADAVGDDASRSTAHAPSGSADGEEAAAGDDDEVDDATAVFAELQDEVEMVGFDELQDELADLEFDEFDDDDEVEMDELLGDDVDVEDDSFLEAGAADLGAGSDDVIADELAGVEAGPDADPDSGAADQPGEPESEAESASDPSASPRPTDVDATTPTADATDRSPDADEVDADADRETDEGTGAGRPSDVVPSDDDFEGFAFDDSDLETEPDPTAGAAASEDGRAVDDDLAALENIDFADPEVGDAPDGPERSGASDDDPNESETGTDVGGSVLDADESEADVEASALDAPESEAGEPSAVETDDGEADTGDSDRRDGDREADAAHPGSTADLDGTEGLSSAGTGDDTDAEAGFEAGDVGVGGDTVGGDDTATTDFDVEGFDESAGFDDDFDALDDDLADREFDDGGEFRGPESSFDPGVDVGDAFASTDDDGAPGSQADADVEPEASDSGDGEAVAEAIPVPDVPGAEVVPDVSEPDREEPTESGPKAADRSRSPSPSRDDGIQSVRVDVEQVDSLLALVESLVTSRVRIRHAIEQGEDRGTIDRELDDLEAITSELQETVMDVRLVPLRTVVDRLPRIVRDIARDQDKEVAFELSGEDVELDRTVLDRIGDPLVHLVRNAIDHGIEPPAEREAAGKPPEGTVELRAERSRDRVTIAVEDDGSGIDPDRLRSAAVEAGVLTDAEAADLPDDEVYDLVFHPGLSTVDEVTDVSGRGVGMDVVKRTIDALDGTVSVDSESGEGTTVTMTLPVTLAIAEVLFVESGGEEFGVPLKAVDEIEDADVVEAADGRTVVRNDDGEVSVVELADALGTPGGGANGDGTIVHIRDEVRPVALHCDEVRGQQEVVVKPFEGFMADLPGLSGATVRGRGEVVNILDVNSL